MTFNFSFLISWLQAVLALNSTYKMLKTEDSVATTDGFSDFMMENFLSLADKISEIINFKKMNNDSLIVVIYQMF